MDRARYTPVPNERELLQRTAEGSREAFETLYAHYYSSLYRYVSFIITLHEDTEEIIQDIFLKVWMKKETLVGIRSFEDYLFRMAKNRVFDVSRQSKSRLKLTRNLGELLPAAEDTIFDGLLFRAYHTAAQEAIQLLPQRKREIFLMHTRDDLTAQDIADRLGTTRGAIKKQLFEAIHFIKKHLARNAGWLALLAYMMSAIG